MFQEISESERHDAANVIEAKTMELLMRMPDKLKEINSKSKQQAKVLETLIMWAAIIVTILHGSTCLKDVWRLVVNGVWGTCKVKISEQAIYKRAGGKAWETMREIFLYFSEKMHGWYNDPFLDKFTFARNIFALDDSVLDKIAKKHGTFENTKKGEPVLAGRITSLYDIRSGQFRKVEFKENARQNEKIAGWEFLEEIPEKSLLLFDLGYFSFRWFDELKDKGLFYISRLREKTSFKCIHVFLDTDSVKDCLVWLGKHRADRAKHAVRMVRVKYRNQYFTYITDIINPRELSAGDILKLYGLRWNIEIAFRFIKQILSLKVIWCCNLEAIKLQIYATLIVAQMHRAVRREIAIRAGVPEDYVSDLLLPRIMQQILMHTNAKDPIKLILESHKNLGLIRKPRRVVYQTPEIDQSKILPLPENTVLVRVPRYAGKM